MLALGVWSMGGYWLRCLQSPSLPDVTVLRLRANLWQLDAQIRDSEHRVKELKPDNHARIVWHNDTARQITPLAIVYLHDFAASPREANTLPDAVAQSIQANLYLARLKGHGTINSSLLKNMQPDELIESAQRALAIGTQIGERVVLMGSGTGAALASILAAQNPDKVAALLLCSPNFGFDPFVPKNTAESITALAQIFPVLQPRQVLPFHEHIDLIHYTNPYPTTSLQLPKTIARIALLPQILPRVKQPVWICHAPFAPPKQYLFQPSSQQIQNAYQKLASSDSLKQQFAFNQANSPRLFSDKKLYPQLQILMSNFLKKTTFSTQQENQTDEGLQEKQLK